MEAVKKEEYGNGKGKRRRDKRKRKIAKFKERAGRNLKGYDKIKEAIENRRTPYEESNYLQNWQDVKHPGYPSFYDFAIKRQADKFYQEVDPTWGYTKTKELPFGFAFQRWRGAQTSKDRQNYRAPYWVTRTPGQHHWIDYPLSKLYYGHSLRDLTEPYEQFKYGHRIAKTKSSKLDKVKQFPGNFLPFLNTLLAGKATVGGTGIDEVAIELGAYKYGKHLQNKQNRIYELEDALLNNRDNYTPQQISDMEAEKKKLEYYTFYSNWPASLAAAAAAWQVTGANTNLNQEGLVIPTAALMRNPYNKGVDNVNEYYDKLEEKASRTSRENLLKSNQKELNRLLDAYEKEYGFRPTLPPAKTPPKTVPVTKTTKNRGSNRNPIFLDKGGKLYFKK